MPCHGSRSNVITFFSANKYLTQVHQKNFIVYRILPAPKEAIGFHYLHMSVLLGLLLDHSGNVLPTPQSHPQTVPSPGAWRCHLPGKKPGNCKHLKIQPSSLLKKQQQSSASKARCSHMLSFPLYWQKMACLCHRLKCFYFADWRFSDSFSIPELVCSGSISSLCRFHYVT